MNTQFKKQQCYVVGLALGWIGYAIGLAYFSHERQWVVLLLWMVGVPWPALGALLFLSPHLSLSRLWADRG